MLIRRPLSLRTRLGSITAIVFLIGMLALYVAAQGYGRSAADRSFDRLLQGSALSISETISIIDDQVRVDMPYAALDMLSTAPDDRVFYRVIGPSNRTITGYTDLPVPKEISTATVRESDPIRFFDATYRGEPVRFVLVGREIAVRGHAGWVWVQVGQTRLAREAVARETVLGAVAPIAAMTVVALAAVWFSIGRALQPLRRIGAEVAERPPSDLRAIDTPMSAELRPLIEAINGFMRRLADNIDTLRAFIADASHQMRTPLAALLAQAQAAQAGEPAQVHRSLEAIERNGVKLAHLLNQLLSDATVAHRADVRCFAPFDLLAALREAIRDSVGGSEGSDVRLRTPFERALCNGDRLMLIEAMKNLIHNAMHHGAGDDNRVDVELVGEADTYVVNISDRGPGIRADQRERVFERFARIDRDRWGAGIGLAIVRRAVESQGGTITMADRPGGGLTVTVRLLR